MSELLWTPGRIGPMTLKNRTVRSATNEHLSERDGQLTQAWLEVQEELVRNQLGMVITGHLCVDRTQRADEGQPVLDEGTDLSYLWRAAQAARRCDTRLVAQLSHSGMKAPESVNKRPPKAPQDFSLEELDWLVGRFRTAALLAREAGLDGVQIHTAHGYCLSNFLNPRENMRQDEYGGSLENRFRLVGRILQAVRESCGEGFALLVKADANGCGDLHGLLELFQQAGVDGVEVSGLDFSSRIGEKEPFYLQNVLEAREGIRVPLILVGGIYSRQSAERVLQTGISFVSFSRSLICQPDFIARMKAGEQEESGCWLCNACYRVYRGRPVRCVQHTTPISQLEKVFGPY